VLVTSMMNKREALLSVMDPRACLATGALIPAVGKPQTTKSDGGVIRIEINLVPTLDFSHFSNIGPSQLLNISPPIRFAQVSSSERRID